MAIQNPRDLFLYDLRAMYDIEQQLMQMLPALAQECMDNAAREAFVSHEYETRQHISNLEQCFQIIESQPATLANNAVAGLRKDHDDFLQQQPPVQALTLFDLRAGYLSECLEIAAYQNLIDEANSLGLKDCVLLFQQNLQQEVNASQKLAGIAHQYALQQLQPAQNAAPAAPGPNPYAVPNPPMPNQSSADTNSPVQAQDKGTTSPQPQVNRASQVQAGMPVVGSDMSNVGLVKEVRDDDFLVDIPMQRDLYIPFTAIQQVDADQVVLNVPRDQINDMHWAKPSLF